MPPFTDFIRNNPVGDALAKGNTNRLRERDLNQQYLANEAKAAQAIQDREQAMARDKAVRDAYTAANPRQPAAAAPPAMEAGIDPVAVPEEMAPPSGGIRATPPAPAAPNFRKQAMENLAAVPGSGKVIMQMSLADATREMDEMQKVFDMAAKGQSALAFHYAQSIGFKMEPGMAKLLQNQYIAKQMAEVSKQAKDLHSRPMDAPKRYDAVQKGFEAAAAAGTDAFAAVGGKPAPQPAPQPTSAAPVLQQGGFDPIQTRPLGPRPDPLPEKPVPADWQALQGTDENGNPIHQRFNRRSGQMDDMPNRGKLTRASAPNWKTSTAVIDGKEQIILTNSLTGEISKTGLGAVSKQSAGAWKPITITQNGKPILAMYNSQTRETHVTGLAVESKHKPAAPAKKAAMKFLPSTDDKGVTTWAAANPDTGEITDTGVRGKQDKTVSHYQFLNGGTHVGNKSTGEITATGVTKAAAVGRLSTEAQTAEWLADIEAKIAGRTATDADKKKAFDSIRKGKNSEGDRAKLGARILEAMLKNPLDTTPVAEKLAKVKQAVDALYGKASNPGGSGGSKAQTPAKPGAGANKPVSAPPALAIQYLRDNPGYQGEFDQKYGSGAAAKILGN